MPMTSKVTPRRVRDGLDLDHVARVCDRHGERLELVVVVVAPLVDGETQRELGVCRGAHAPKPPGLGELIQGPASTASASPAQSSNVSVSARARRRDAGGGEHRVGARPEDGPQRAAEHLAALREPGTHQREEPVGVVDPHGWGGAPVGERTSTDSTLRRRHEHRRGHRADDAGIRVVRDLRRDGPGRWVPGAGREALPDLALGHHEQAGRRSAPPRAAGRRPASRCCTAGSTRRPTGPGPSGRDVDVRARRRARRSRRRRPATVDSSERARAVRRARARRRARPSRRARRSASRGPGPISSTARRARGRRGARCGAPCSGRRGSAARARASARGRDPRAARARSWA